MGSKAKINPVIADEVPWSEPKRTIKNTEKA